MQYIWIPYFQIAYNLNKLLFEFDKDEIIEYVITKDKEIKNVLHDCDSLG